MCTYLCNARDGDGYTVPGVDLITLHVESKSIQRDSERKNMPFSMSYLRERRKKSN